MNVKEIKEMVVLMNENNLLELEVEKDGMRIKLKKNTAQAPEAQGAPIFIERERAPAPVLESKAQEAASSKIASNRIEVKSPMVGTFYRAPSPEAPPFAQVNQDIEPGQVVCIIEAMKLMNEIKSEVRGKVLEILVDNAEPVEFGQALFLIETR
ncbi:MAG: acetyl-CoA carboxylase biotin carboxyl carrier protein [Candidatus Omnitrophota bacterium]